MDIARSRLKQIIKEEIQKFQLDENWGERYAALVITTKDELQMNDGRHASKWVNPAEIIAGAVIELTSDTQDQIAFTQDVIEGYNSSEYAKETGKIGVEVEDVFDVLN